MYNAFKANFRLPMALATKGRRGPWWAAEHGPFPAHCPPILEVAASANCVGCVLARLSS